MVTLTLYNGHKLLLMSHKCFLWAVFSLCIYCSVQDNSNLFPCCLAGTCPALWFLPIYHVATNNAVIKKVNKKYCKGKQPGKVTLLMTWY